MKMQHTPGPWVASPAIRSGFTIDAKCDPWLIVSTSDEEGRYGGIETEANARLIAAAPDLLEALRTLVSMAESFPSELHKDHPDVIEALAAIAKATGE